VLVEHSGVVSLRKVGFCLAFELRGMGKPHVSAGQRLLPELLGWQGPTAVIILSEGRLLSSNIGELIRVAPRPRRNMAGSGRETLISQAGDFFALRWAPTALAQRLRAAGGALL
jgi:hypothetical protein